MGTRSWMKKLKRVDHGTNVPQKPKAIQTPVICEAIPMPADVEEEEESSSMSISDEEVVEKMEVRCEKKVVPESPKKQPEMPKKDDNRALLENNEKKPKATMKDDKQPAEERQYRRPYQTRGRAKMLKQLG